MRMRGIRRNQKISINATGLLAAANMWRLSTCQACYQWVLQLWSVVWRLVFQPSQEDVIRGRNFQAWTRERENGWPKESGYPQSHFKTKHNKKATYMGRVSWECSINQTLYLNSVIVQSSDRGMVGLIFELISQNGCWVLCLFFCRN